MNNSHLDDELEQTIEQLKAHNGQLVEAIDEILKEQMAWYSDSRTVPDNLVVAALATSTPISQQYIKEQRARDEVINMAREEVECNPFVYIDLRKALDNLKEIEKGE